MKKMRGEEGKKKVRKGIEKRGGNDRQETGIGCEKKSRRSFHLERLYNTGVETFESERNAWESELERRQNLQKEQARGKV